MRQYINYDAIVRRVKCLVEEYGFILDGNPELEMQQAQTERIMERGSYRSFYFNIISEKTKPYRRGIWFEITRHDDGLYSYHASFKW